jgi:hypothetical protein
MMTYKGLTLGATGDTCLLNNVKVLRFANRISLLIGLLMIAIVPGFGQRESSETLDATASGTSTQLGRNVGVKVIIYEFSSPEDRASWYRHASMVRTTDW